MDKSPHIPPIYFMHAEFTNVWETAFDVTDQTFDCEVNRTGTADNKMVSGLNSFVRVCVLFVLSCMCSSISRGKVGSEVTVHVSSLLGIRV